MDRTTFPWATVGGYDFYEVLSALQKTINAVYGMTRYFGQPIVS